MEIDDLMHLGTDEGEGLPKGEAEGGGGELRILCLGGGGGELRILCLGSRVWGLKLCGVTAWGLKGWGLQLLIRVQGLGS